MYFMKRNENRKPFSLLTGNFKLFASITILIHTNYFHTFLYYQPAKNMSCEFMYEQIIVKKYLDFDFGNIHKQ